MNSSTRPRSAYVTGAVQIAAGWNTFASLTEIRLGRVSLEMPAIC